MLFNSFGFIFGFLPVTLAVVLGLAALHNSMLSKLALIGASLVFYGWAGPQYVPLLLFLVAFTYIIGLTLMRVRQERRALRVVILCAGLLTCVGVLGFYKYANVAVDTINVWTDRHVVLAPILLPLGLSFITFQVIAFLIDMYNGSATRVSPIDYCLSVTFFPKLIAGPIVDHRAVIPQFETGGLRGSPPLIVAGLTLFVIGLLKKVALADGVAIDATALFAAAAQGGRIDVLAGWAGAVCYTLQLYFDFSGYCDMALGIGMMFGIFLPLNFDSPYKACNIIEFWQRWHVTLTRFLTAHIYNPLGLSLMRWWAARGWQTGARGRMKPVAFAALVAFPTLTTMTIAGIWHGAGFQFAIFGMLHGMYLVFNHAWRTFFRSASERFPHSAAVAITFAAVVVAFVFFRAESVTAAISILAGMAGVNGVVLPDIPQLAPIRGALAAHGIEFGPHVFGLRTYAWLATLMLLVFAAPNSMQLIRPLADVSRFGWNASPGTPSWHRYLAVEPRATWMVLIALGAAYGLLQIPRSSAFLYFKF